MRVEKYGGIRKYVVGGMGLGVNCLCQQAGSVVMVPVQEKAASVGCGSGQTRAVGHGWVSGMECSAALHTKRQFAVLCCAVEGQQC